MTQPGIARSLRDVHPLFEATFNSADVDGLLALYEPDALLASTAGQEPARGRDQIRAAVLNFLAGGATIQLETVLALETGDMGLLQGRWLLRGNSLDGNPFVLNGTSVEVLRRQPDGRWLYVIDSPFGVQ